MWWVMMWPDYMMFSRRRFNYIVRQAAHTLARPKKEIIKEVCSCITLPLLNLLIMA